MTQSGPELKKSGLAPVVSASVFSVLLAAALWLMILTPAIAQTVPAGTPDVPTAPAITSPTLQPDGRSGKAMTTEERITQLEKLISATESRSLFIKMATYELVAYLRWIVAALLVIALVFPITIWLMSRKRILGLSGLSDELAGTLLTVEERQAKLANILKEIQSEVDYLHTMSVPDLKGLIAQAERYLEQNERDLEKAGGRKGRRAGSESTPQGQ